MSTEPIIKCRGVHKWFGDFHALRGIDLDVFEGEVIVILSLIHISEPTRRATISRMPSSA